MVNKNVKGLKITEITEKATISVMASFGNKKLELPTEYAFLNELEMKEVVAKYGEKILPLENVLQVWQEKLREVSFKGTVSKLDLIAVTSAGVYKWDNVKIYKYDFRSGRHIHVAVPITSEGIKYNRRRGVRINVDKIMDVEQGANMYSVIVRDISYCGVAFVEPLGAQLNPDERFVLHFTESTDKGDRLVALLTGKINNRKDYDKGGVLNGCVLSPDHASFMQKYIATKQIEAIRGKKKPAALSKTKTGDYWKEELGDEFKKRINKK